ncbi:UNVERIFIED_CONTAM: hypothetical protein PYX00_011482 [Menopon gallinae]|uniref:glycine--tRNA ligase n=1 Tax=Menopon gallinae TaxID=328185 RepID=A0AAW2H7Y4_9NEOP
MHYTTDGRKVENLLKKRFFIAQSSQIYGGVSGLYDYGPLGCALKNAVVAVWRRDFVVEEALFELDTSILLPYEVLKASGHVDKFSDLLVFDKETGEFYRADHVIKKRLEERDQTSETREALSRLESLTLRDAEEVIARLGIRSDRGNELVGATEFNLIFRTSIGPKSQSLSFLRPETAQGQFLNFKRLYDMNYEKLPLGSATVGRVFRNEISPRSGLLRVREFDQAEVEYFVDPLDKTHQKFDAVSHLELNLLFEDKCSGGGDGVCRRMCLGEAVRRGTINNETLAYFIAKTYMFLTAVGVKDEYLRFRQHKRDEMAHYACDCWDAEILTSYGWIECVGIADRSSYDLCMHQSHSKSNMSAKRVLKTPVEIVKWAAVIDKKALGRKLKGDLSDFIQHVENDVDQKLNKGGAVPGQESETDTGGACGDRMVIKVSFKGQLHDVEVVRKCEKSTTEEFVPHVIEPSFGLGRILYALCEHAFWPRDQERLVLSFAPAVAPVQCEVSFLMRDERLASIVDAVYKSLRGCRAATNKRSVSIGKKYAVADEIGVPYYVTVDFETLEDNQVTIRNRDTMEQIRVEIPCVRDIVLSLVAGTSEWSAVSSCHKKSC